MMADHIGVALVAAHFPPRVGGVERYVQAIAATLKQDSRFKPVVVTAAQKGAAASMSVEEGVTVYRLRPSVVVSNTPVGLRWAKQIKRLFEAERISVVHAHSPVPFLPDVSLLAAGER